MFDVAVLLGSGWTIPIFPLKPSGFAAAGRAIVGLADGAECECRLGAAAKRAASPRSGMQRVLELVEQRLG